MEPEITAAIRKAAEVIGSAESLAITGHVNPDGDALGSALALAHAARIAGTDAVVSFGGGSVIPDHYGFLDLGPVVDRADFPHEPDVMVVFDTGSPDRLADLAGPAAAAGTLVVVDHHVTNDGFGDVAVIDPTASASALLAYHLIRALGWTVDARVATALHTGLVTDTGRFQYSNTDADTLRVAADLLEAGARPDEIGQAVYESVPFGYLRVASSVLGRARLEPELSFVWSYVTDEDLGQGNVGPADLDGLIDDLRIAREAGVAALLKQVSGGYKVSLRSRGGVDVGAIALDNGGGGHHNAAGFTAEGTPAEIVERVRAGLR
ncbi:MAG: bifunctional oligoribonuclease/PAP phosphatase NrnA [Acidimicrobiia bacterium]|nr:bifunctional oligoribonuclease/PAP phosphatase NrnA [Acidimicrobiia bacterium]